MSEPVPAIDWKAENGKRVNENIELTAKFKAKILAQAEEIQELKRVNEAQAQSIQQMRPANEKRKAAELALEETQRRWAERLNEANGTIRELRTKLARGQKGVINDVIAGLQASYRSMPDPLPEDSDG
jgi:FtsZ-binding cell division protein ZapB